MRISAYPKWIQGTIVLLIFISGCSNSINENEVAMPEEIYSGIWLDDEFPPVLSLTKSIQVNDLEYVDLIDGDGEVVTDSDTLEVDYLGVGGLSKSVFDSSFSRNQTAIFPLQAVIAGWQDGLVGMREGGRRLLIIPGALAYGDNPPSGSGIRPNETLIFLVDVIEIK